MAGNFNHYLKIGFQAINSLMFPPVCVFCGVEHVGFDSHICKTCNKDISPVEDPICDRCGLPVAGTVNSQNQLCGKCSKNSPALDKTRFCVFYSRVIRRGILKFKFSNSLFLGEALSGFLVKAFEENYSDAGLDAIVPIPVHDDRLIQRGYNQSAILAKKLGKKVGLNVLTNCLAKSRNTTPQTQLKRKERLANIKGSFFVRNPLVIKNKRLLILDDVFTTGSTVSEAASVLKSHGAQSVNALVLGLRYGDIDKDSKTDLEAYREIFFIGGKSR